MPNDPAVPLLSRRALVRTLPNRIVRLGRRLSEDPVEPVAQGGDPADAAPALTPVSRAAVREQLRRLRRAGSSAGEYPRRRQEEPCPRGREDDESESPEK